MNKQQSKKKSEPGKMWEHVKLPIAQNELP